MVMDVRLRESVDNAVAATVAPEDLRRGDYVAVLSEIVEVPSFFWTEALACAQAEAVRIRRLPTEDRAPLKVKAICLPFVFVKQHTGQFQTLDVRLASLVRLDEEYAKTVWKSLRAKPPQFGLRI
jgi:hypothetical protein